ncbi:MAG TPA: hypothetical protein VED87_04835 [Methylocystis sp.]|nr:hypothetical protein [Methylocystis sp.]
MSFTFDRLAYIDRLTAAGFEDRQARAHADALDAALHESVASKGDVQEVRKEISELNHELRKEIADVRLEMRQMETRLETKLEARIEITAASIKVEILRWLIVTQIGLAGFILAALKYVK